MSRIDASVDFWWQRGRRLLAEPATQDCLPLNASFSVRWAGFLRPSLAQTYTMFTVVSGSDERVKLWVDNQLLIDQWQ
eukprot:57542-Rhodomonas_salina.2